jgi:hypothetical protein
MLFFFFQILKCSFLEKPSMPFPDACVNSLKSNPENLALIYAQTKCAAFESVLMALSFYWH